LHQAHRCGYDLLASSLTPEQPNPSAATRGLFELCGERYSPVYIKASFNLATLGRKPETREHIGTMNAQGPSRRMARMELANLAFVGTWFKGVQGVGTSFAK